jgi:hypothetical protein
MRFLQPADSRNDYSYTLLEPIRKLPPGVGRLKTSKTNARSHHTRPLRLPQSSRLAPDLISGNFHTAATTVYRGIGTHDELHCRESNCRIVVQSSGNAAFPAIQSPIPAVQCRRISILRAILTTYPAKPLWGGVSCVSFCGRSLLR